MFKNNIKFKKFKNNLISNLQGFSSVWIILIIFFLIIIGFFVFLKLNFQNNNKYSLNSQKNENDQSQTGSKFSPLFSKIKEIQKNQLKETDTDQDGLSDDKEKEIYKTDPNKKDTDEDGLSDWQEIVVYFTNPLKADTDNDGADDKQEIENNTNPKGGENINRTNSSPLGNSFIKR